MAIITGLFTDTTLVNQHFFQQTIACCKIYYLLISSGSDANKLKKQFI